MPLGSIFGDKQTNADEPAAFSPRSKIFSISTDSGEARYRIKELTARERNILLFTTCKLIGASTGSAIESWLGNVSEAVALTGIISGLYHNATPSQLTEFVEQVIKDSLESPANAKNDYDNHFCQYYDHQWHLIAAIYQFNFGGTILELKKKLSHFGLLIPKSLKSENREQTNKTDLQTEIPARPRPTSQFSSGK